MSSHPIPAFSLPVLVFALLVLPVGADTITADFTAHDSFTHGFAPFTASFEDRSVMAASWLWNFGDGQTSTESNPVHTYANPGSYSVTLTIHDTTGTLTSTKTLADYIVVGEDPMHPSATTAAVTASPTYSIVYTTTTVPATTTTPEMSGSLAVTSVPTGAMVTLDGIPQGITPITLYNVAVGDHSVLVHTKGYVDNTTIAHIEYQKITDLPVILANTGAAAVTTRATLATTTTPVPETTMTQAAKAAAAPGFDISRAPGAIHVYCDGCLNLTSQKYWDKPRITSIQYEIADTAGKDVLNTAVDSEDMIMTGLTPGSYRVVVIPMDHRSQTKIVNVTPMDAITVRFKGSTFVSSPGFEIIAAVFALAGLIGIRSFRN
jgi:PKD repeat protein